ncbi:MAG: HAMP domain-containing sensor histidine kinase [Verrucomicrobiota bacterium]
MSRINHPKPGGWRFRTKLRAGMMLVVLALTGLGLFLARQKVEHEAALDLQQNFRNTLATLNGIQEVRHAALAERCRALVRRPRIHAALEDDALDLLYPSARDELRDMMPDTADAGGGGTSTLRACFYRFLDSRGAVIPAPPGAEVGALSPSEEARLSLPRVPESRQPGYLARESADASGTVNEVIAEPIISTETGEVIAALVLGFKPAEQEVHRLGLEIRSGIQFGPHLHLPGLEPGALAALAAALSRSTDPRARAADNFPVNIDGEPHQVFHKRLNPGSLYPPANKVVIYPLTAARARLGQLRAQILTTGAALLLAGMAASYFLTERLSAPVEKLEIDSEKDRQGRARAESDLKMTSAELRRAARFSSDASHQLKTPITVLRAGLDELLASDGLSPALREEVSALIHQTYRLTGIVEDLLLLSRMDAGRLEISFSTIDLRRMIDGLMDDLSAVPDPLDLEVEADCPEMRIAGEERHVALILQNLLENARKYNRPGGRVRIACRADGDCGCLLIGNTGRAIPPAAREHIFERFHRGTAGENIPGHGLGLNLARELARLHGGELRLVRSGTDWTEFEVRFQLAGKREKSPPLTSSGPGPAE